MNKVKMIFLIILLSIIVLVIAGIAAYVSSCNAKQEVREKASLYTLSIGEPAVTLNVDGNIGENWDRFKLYQTEKATVYLTSDDQNLYIGVEAKEDTTDDAFQDHVILCFISNETLKVEIGEFKTIEIWGNGRVLWQTWNEVERLPVEHARRYEEYATDLAARLKVNEAVRVYNGNKLLGKEEDGVYALFARNIDQIPEGLVAETDFEGYRTYTAKVSLSLLGVEPGQTIRFFGVVHDYSAHPQNFHFPNSRTKSLADAYYKRAVISGKP